MQKTHRLIHLFNYDEIFPDPVLLYLGQVYVYGYYGQCTEIYSFGAKGLSNPFFLRWP